MEDHEIIGYVGGVLLAVTSLPQIYKTFKTKKTDDISIYFIFLQIVTCVIFLTYGVLIDANPIKAANSILLFELLLLLYAKIKFSYFTKIIIKTNSNSSISSNLTIKSESDEILNNSNTYSSNKITQV